MYLGEIVEKGSANPVFDSPSHPYTQLLVGSIPDLDPASQSLATPLTEAIPDPSNPPEGCRFHTRCPAVIPAFELDISHDVWIHLMRFRFAVQEAEYSPPLERAIVNGSSDAVRDVLSLPKSLPDEKIESGISRAIAALVAGDRSAAGTILEETLPTVCEQESPMEQEKDGKRVACHRHDPRIEADPVEW